MIILRARLKPYGGSSEFISVSSKIKSLIEKNPEEYVPDNYPDNKYYPND